MADGRVVIEAILDTANVVKNVKGLKSELSGVTWDDISKGTDKAKALGGAFKSAGTACTMTLTAPIAAAGAAAFSTASDYEAATARIQSALGLTADEAERLGEVGEGVYEDGFGQSLEQVDDALVAVRQSLGDLNDADLSYVTQSVLALSDTLGMDVGESVRGVNALMDGFGLSAAEAMDLFAAGAQDGLNYSDELGDNLAEYGPRFAQMGFSASQYFSILKSGTESGAYSLDKVNDFLNEFQTSLSDGRMDESIGRFSQSTQELFQAWKDGGATGQQVFEAVLGELAGMPDGYEKANLASELWSSLGEDNAMGMITSLAGVEDKYGDVAGAAGEAGEAASDSFASRSQEALRKLQGALEPFGEPLLNIASMVAEVASAFGSWLSSLPAPAQQAVFVLAAIVAAIGPVLSLVGSVVAAMPALSAAVTVAAGAFRALGAAMAANPIGIVVMAVGTLVAAFATLWSTSEEFRGFWIGVWEGAKAAVASVVEWFTGTFMPAVSGLFSSVGQAASSAWSVVSSGAQAVVSAVVGFFSGLSSGVGAVWDAVVGVVTGAASAIYSGIVAYLGLVQSFWSSAWGAVSSVASGVWNGILGTIGSIVSAISGTISSVFNGVKSTVTGVWNGIKSAITSPMTAARDLVRGIINAIKGFFNFSISWPHIPLPHFSIRPSGWQIGDLLKGSIPSLGIDWYAKGGVFASASVIGVGEAGPEAVVPLSGSRMRPFAEAVASQMEADTRTAAEVRALRRELPAMLSRYSARSITVDGREFARAVAATEGLY